MEERSLDLGIVEESVHAVLALADLPTDEALPGPEPTAAFVRSLRDYGLFHPIVVEAAADGSYLVGAGGRRIKAARQLGWTHIPASVFPVGSSVCDVLRVVENTHRADNDVATFDALQALIQKHGPQSNRDLCAALGIDPPKLSKLLRLRDLNEHLLTAFREGKIRTSAAYQAARLPGKVQAGLALRLALHGRLTVAEVKEAEQVRTQAEIERTLTSGLFETPSAAAAESAPCWPVHDMTGQWQNTEDLEHTFLSRLRPLSGPSVVDAEGRAWRPRVAITVTMEPV